MGHSLNITETDLDQLAGQLADFSLKYDPYQQKDVSKEHIKNTFVTLLDKNRVIYKLDPNGDLIGFVESWRINYEQFGKLICNPNKQPDLRQWDIETGNICYLGNILIHPDFRQGLVIRYLKTEFFKQNFMCEYFVGERVAKKHKPVKVFSRKDFLDYYDKGENNG